MVGNSALDAAIQVRILSSQPLCAAVRGTAVPYIKPFLNFTKK